VDSVPRKRVYFHDGSTAGDIEDATKFYVSAAFLESPSHVVLLANVLLNHCPTVECLNLVSPFGLEKLAALRRGGLCVDVCGHVGRDQNPADNLFVHVPLRLSNVVYLYVICIP
jgi:hypothetical protein